MTYIANDVAWRLAKVAQETNAPVIDVPVRTLTDWQIQAFANAAIQHYIDSNALGKDVARYQFLKQEQVELGFDFANPYLVLLFEASGHNLDEAIDAAITAQEANIC